MFGVNYALNVFFCSCLKRGISREEAEGLYQSSAKCSKEAYQERKRRACISLQLSVQKSHIKRGSGGPVSVFS
jgi:hypothetical protein